MRLATQWRNFQEGESIEWIHQLIGLLKIIRNLISRVVDLWVNCILEEYIIDIVVDIIKLYSETEREFFQGPRGRYLTYLNIWIKMLVYEKQILRMEFGE